MNNNNIIRIDNRRNKKIYSYNINKNLVEVGSGIKLRDIMIHISKNNHYIEGLPGYSQITAGGAVNSNTLGKDSKYILESVNKISFLDINGKFKTFDKNQLKKNFSLLKSSKIYITKVQFKLKKSNYNYIKKEYLANNSLKLKKLIKNKGFQFFQFKNLDKKEIIYYDFIQSNNRTKKLNCQKNIKYILLFTSFENFFNSFESIILNLVTPSSMLK